MSDAQNEETFIVGACFIRILPAVLKDDSVNVLDQAAGENGLRYEAITWPLQLWRRRS